MANSVRGRIVEIGKLERIQTKGGTTFEKLECVLDASRYDAITGEKGYDNFVVLEFSQNKIEQIQKFKIGDAVEISFELTGNRYQNQQGETKYMTRARAYKVEPIGKKTENKVEQAPQVAPQKGGDLPF